MAIKIVTIGCGWVAMECHGPAIQEYAALHEDVLLTGCCDLDLARAEQFRQRFGFRHAYANVNEMLEVEHPDAVCLMVPPQFIADMGCSILEQGYPLLTEKPPGLSIVDIDRLVEAAQTKGIIHQVAFNRRFMPLVLELKNRLASCAVQHIDVRMLRVQRTDPVFATTAVHAIDSARFLVGSDYAQVDFHYQEMPELGEGVANYQIAAQFINGTTAHLGFYPVTGVNVERSIIYARDHTFFLDANNGPDMPGRLRHFHLGQPVDEITSVEITGRKESFILNGFYAEDAAFFDAVRKGVQSAHGFESARQSVAMMHALALRQARLVF
jgi:myo-inositol 2-dehydrogenase/D-chiro-inositol 1-dehydrogenase